jgi:DNA polymerase I-like protein with 3'-5' exonuclease and polymerase domains
VRPNPLPDVDGLTVAVDTETSSLFTDDGGRPSVASWSFRVPAEQDMTPAERQAFAGYEPGKVAKWAACWDQGQDPLTVLRATAKKNEVIDEALFNLPFGGLPLGPKDLPLRHSKRLRKWLADSPVPEVGQGAELLQAPNRQPDAWGRLLRWLARQRLVFHNAKFDLHHLAVGLRGCEGKAPEEGGGLDLVANTIFDTQLTQFVLTPREGSSLKPTSVRLKLGTELGLDAGTEDAEQQALKPWKGPQTDPRFDLIPWKVLRPYAALDAALTIVLYEYQLDLLDDAAFGNELRHARRELALMRTLYGMERRGIGYAVDESREQADIARKLMDEVASGLPFKPTYPGAQKYFFGPAEDEEGNPTGNLGHLPYSDKMTAPSKTHPKGQPQVDEEVIDRLAKEGVPHAKEFARWAELSSANSKWYQAWADLTGADGRLRTSHKQTAVISGRLSVQRAQLQAIPQNYQIPQGLRPPRDLFVPKPGHQLWEVDVSQAEIRIATAMARCQEMLDQFLSGQDSHSAACWLMFRDEFQSAGFDTLEAASGAAVVGGVTQPGHPKWDEYRQVAKRCNLGILYGAGAGTVKEQIAKFTGIEYPLSQVRQWVNDWRAAFPPFVRFLEATARKATQDGWVRLINGRVRWFSDYEPTHKAANQVIQGSQAEVIKDCLVQVDREFPGAVILCIHDSILSEFPLTGGVNAVTGERYGSAEQMADRVQAILVEQFERAFAKPWKNRGGEVVTVPFKADKKMWKRQAPDQSQGTAA